MEHSDIQLVRRKVEEIYRVESRRVLATLIRLVGEFDLAEEAMHDAFASAVEQWGRDGIPNNPRAWLVSAGRFKAIDVIRRRSRFDASLPKLAVKPEAAAEIEEDVDGGGVEDDRLRLIFTCCHPALSSSTQIALTLREVCGLTTEAIATAFLTTPSTIAQRIVRGKAKIRDARIPYQVPSMEDLPARLDSVLAVIYLVFNEGYSASSGESLTRADLSGEAIRLGRLLMQLLPDPEVIGLVALMLLHDSRRKARTAENGDLILLEDQDRSLWNWPQIEEGHRLAEQAFAAPMLGVHAIQAAIAAVHTSAADTTSTDWAKIVALYDLLLRAEPSPIVELNRAVAVAMRDGPQAGIELINVILERGQLARYHLLHAAQADLYRRLGQKVEARSSYESALKLVSQEPERRFIEKRLRELDS
ncbi:MULTISPECIES: RNA polymerase sigma factor [unclassified Schlesneria]|uniref:RNA polymerase sigma factor n=1 Tax=Schlesneria TaxID=656899 RepID=UPI0035A0FC65